MSTNEAQAVISTCMLAAFADGAREEREREQVQRIAGRFDNAELDVGGAYQAALLGRTQLADVTRELRSPESKLLAYEMAVCVCDADGAQTAAERVFLASLRDALGLPVVQAAQVSAAAESIAAEPVASRVAVANEAEVESTILNTAILCAGLEQIPQSLATMAIVPLQMRLVYKVGVHYGFELDKRHIADFLAVAGVGMTAQVIDGFARKLIGGLLGRVAGGFVGGLSRRAAGSALAFGTTYALGHLAKRYYAGGRKLTGEELKSAFTDLVARARGVEAQHATDISARARTIDVPNLLSLVRGS